MNLTFEPLQIVDLDNPFFFGVGRQMNPSEQRHAAAHGIPADRPMSILGIAGGLAAVDGIKWARLIVAAPVLLSKVMDLMHRLESIRDTDKSGLALDADIESARRAIEKATGMDTLRVP